MIRRVALDELGRKSLEEFKRAPKKPLVLVLDNIRSAHNVGSLFRSADAFLIEAIYLCGYTPTPEGNLAILKTALGATKAVAWKYMDTVSEALSALKKKEYVIVSLEQTDQSAEISTYSKPPHYAGVGLVCGNEVKGVSDEALALTDDCVEIAQSGTKHSLNVSVAGGIALWHLSRVL